MLENLTHKYLVIEFISNKDQKFIELAGLNIELYENYIKKVLKKFWKKNLF